MSPESTKYLREMGDQFFLTVAVLEIAYKVYLAMVLPDPTTTPLDRIGHLCGALFFIRIWKGWIDEAATLAHFKGDRWAFCVTREAAKALEINCHSFIAAVTETICLASHGNGAHSGLSRFSTHEMFWWNTVNDNKPYRHGIRATNLIDPICQHYDSQRTSCSSPFKSKLRRLDVFRL